jgi:hypothetical protein
VFSGVGDEQVEVGGKEVDGGEGRKLRGCAHERELDTRLRKISAA